MLSVKDGNTVVKPAAGKLVVRTNLYLCYESLPGPRSIESDEKKRASERELVGSPFENWKKKKKLAMKYSLYDSKRAKIWNDNKSANP